MKIFNWMQKKRKGRHSFSSRKLDLVSSSNYCVQKESCKEEFIEFRNGLLAIGTIGNINLKEPMTKKATPSSPSDDPTPEEVGKFQKELSLLLTDHIGLRSIAEWKAVKNTSNDAYSDDSNKEEGHLQRNKTVAFSRGKDISFDKGFGKKSSSFLLKRMITCSNGFAPAPSLKDPISESRMEKIMRAILHKKIYPQSSSAALSTKKYLKNRVHAPKSANEDDVNEKTENGSKWVKTDSEYIVLEI